MRDLTSTLLTGQRGQGEAICKIVLTSGSTTKAYSRDTTDVIKKVNRKETPYSQTAQVLIENYNNNLSALNLKGYQGVISRGFHTGIARAAWAANTAYVAYVKGVSQASVVRPTTANGYQYRCVVAGTSLNGAEPAWSTITFGQTITDGTVTWEMDGNSGDEYSLTAPLKVKAQELLNTNGQLVCQLDLFGLPDQLEKDEALTSYTLESTDTQTCKTLIAAIVGSNISSYTHCPVITIVWDSEDSLIDSFIPKDAFHISVGETRLAKIKELLDWTKCVQRYESDGKLHISSPTISGNTWAAATAYVLRDYVQPTTPNNNFTYRCTTAGTSHAATEPTWPTTAGLTVNDNGVIWTAVAHDYEYEDAYTASTHPFFSKIYRTVLVIPNKYVVSTNPDIAPGYSGSATSAASYALLPKTKPKLLRITSDAQGTSIAKALIQRAELDHEIGSLFAPINVGAEVHDYVKVTDNVEGNNRIGNIGYLIETYQPGKFDFYFGFGDIMFQSSIGLVGLSGEVPGEPKPRPPTWENMAELYENQKKLQNQLLALTTTVEQIKIGDTVPKWHVTQQLIIPVETT